MLLKLEELHKEYDKLQQKYGAKELDSTYYGGCTEHPDICFVLMNPGYPLNSISKYKKIDKYFTDVTEEDKKLIEVNEDDVVDFIASHM